MNHIVPSPAFWEMFPYRTAFIDIYAIGYVKLSLEQNMTGEQIYYWLLQGMWHL